MHVELTHPITVTTPAFIGRWVYYYGAVVKQITRNQQAPSPIYYLNLNKATFLTCNQSVYSQSSSDFLTVRWSATKYIIIYDQLYEKGPFGMKV